MRLFLEPTKKHHRLVGVTMSWILDRATSLFPSTAFEFDIVPAECNPFELHLRSAPTAKLQKSFV